MGTPNPSRKRQEIPSIPDAISDPLGMVRNISNESPMASRIVKTIYDVMHGASGIDI
uniref:Uncharacterized protein n=1 Tax=Cucumis melo TaxID=3656 RepID=A0A9I9CU47_CUCME